MSDVGVCACVCVSGVSVADGIRARVFKIFTPTNRSGLTIWHQS